MLGDLPRRSANVAFYLGSVLAFNVMGSFGLSAILSRSGNKDLRRFHVAQWTASDLLASSIVGN